MRIKNSLFALFLCCLFACRDSGEIVVSVGKRKMSDKELIDLYGRYKESVDIKSISKASFISQLVERIILEEEAKKIGVSLTDEEINIFIKENNIDEKKKEMAKLYLLRNKIAEKLVENNKIDENLINEIEKNILEIQPEKYVFYQILLRNKAEAIKALEEINKGLDFTKAVEKYSVSPEKSREGLVDYLNADEIPAELLTQLRKMKKGEISGIVTSPYGYHIIKLKEYIPKSHMDKNLRREKAIQEAKKVLKGDIYADWLTKKKKEYGVNIKWELVEKIN